MDARERDDSQSRRTSIKRPWDEDSAALPEPANSRLSTVLPSLDAEPFRRLSAPRGREYLSISTSRYGAESRDADAERPKIEGHDYNSFARQNIDPNGKPPPIRPHCKSCPESPKAKNNH
jgi:hypothetical protein